MKAKVRCNWCYNVYIDQDTPIPECPVCGCTSVTFISFEEEEMVED
ncbi:hypothetical protein LCGC14_0561090 [marine sediment metagenome]|uniref:Rubredoxin-like domain-containing protein n=1 Tax=marine sediment metagenome TaxID=412755 RepID=A0A0F9UV91_9ZZZZ